MKVIAKKSYVRMSPLKLRRVADVIRGKKVMEVLPQLAFFTQRAADPLLVVLKQAMANASQLGLSGSLRISRLEINQGPAFKRVRPVSRGQAHSIKKYSSHIIMELSAVPSKKTDLQKRTKSVVKEVPETKKTPAEKKTITSSKVVETKPEKKTAPKKVTAKKNTK